MAEFTIKGKTYNIKTPLAKTNPQRAALRFAGGPRNRSIQLAGVGQKGSPRHGNEGVYISSDYYRNDITGKPYPGRINFNTQRVLAYNSTVVRSIITLRAHQVAKLPLKIVPRNPEEPPRQINILEYNVYDLDNHPAFDEDDKTFLASIYERLDPESYIGNKKKLYKENKDDFTPGEQATIDYLQDKHDQFYRKRAMDIKRIKKLLEDPDPWFTNTRSWGQLLKSILMDLLIIDRGTVLLIRDKEGELRGLMPVDGGTVRPLINEYGTYDDDKAYVQVIHGSPQVYLSKHDAMIMSMNPMTDIKYYGYGLSNMETLYTTVLSDIFIDKGNLDFYRKGGSIPEGFISIEPPPSREGMVQQLDQEQLEAIQRHMQSIMMGDYTQLPIISGGKVSYVDFKGKRRDMQFKELAEYLSRKICAVFQVSPQDVGIIADVNRSTSQTQAEMTKSKGLETLMRVISEYFTQHVVNELRPERDLLLWFEDDDLDKEKTRWQMSQQKLITGAITINEWRAMEGRHPVPWGDTPLQGLRNWKPEDENAGGMPGLGNLPPLPGLPTPGNPSGPAGGDNPGAGGPPQDQQKPNPTGSPTNLKSLRFFSMNAATEEEAEEIMIKGFSDMYEENARFSDFLELHDIHNYPGGEWMRNPEESYDFFVNSNPQFGVMVQKSVDELDPRDPLIFSTYRGSGVVEIGEDGQEPFVRAVSKAITDNLDEAKKASLVDIVGDSGLVMEAIERSVYKSLDPELHNLLYEDFYKFQPTELTDSQIEQVGEVLELR